MKHLNKFEEVSSEKKINESTEIMLGDNKIYDVKEGDQLRFMEHYKNHLIKKYSSSFTDEINLDEPVTFVRVESSNLIRPNLIVRTKEGVEWVFGPEAFVLDMKHLKKFEELNYRTYLSAASKLRKISPKKNKERYEELQNHADVIELKKRRSELSKISSPISIKITDTENGKQGVGRFYPLLSPEYDTLQDYLADGTVESIPFTLVIVPADDETVEMCLNTMPEGDDLSVCGYGAMWLSIGLTLDEGTYELDRLKVVDMDQYVYGECELQGRAAYGGIKQTLYRMFSDKSSEFYQEFEETVIAGMGLSSDHGLSMDAIANHLKSLSVNTGFIAD